MGLNDKLKGWLGTAKEATGEAYEKTKESDTFKKAKDVTEETYKKAEVSYEKAIESDTYKKAKDVTAETYGKAKDALTGSNDDDDVADAANDVVSSDG